MADGFAQAGDFFARAMKKQEQAANWQQKAQLPTMTSFAQNEQSMPGSPDFQANFASATLPSIQNAASGVSLRESPEIVSELLSKAKAKRAQTAFDNSSSTVPGQPANGFTPEVSTVGTSVTPSARGQRIPPRLSRAVRAGQISA